MASADTVEDASFTNALFFEGENDLYPVGHLIDLLPGGSTEFFGESADKARWFVSTNFCVPKDVSPL